MAPKVDEALQAVGAVAYVLAALLSIGAVVLAHSGSRDLRMAQYLGFHLSGLSGAEQWLAEKFAGLQNEVRNLQSSGTTKTFLAAVGGALAIMLVAGGSYVGRKARGEVAVGDVAWPVIVSAMLLLMLGGIPFLSMIPESSGRFRIMRVTVQLNKAYAEASERWSHAPPDVYLVFWKNGEKILNTADRGIVHQGYSVEFTMNLEIDWKAGDRIVCEVRDDDAIFSKLIARIEPSNGLRFPLRGKHRDEPRGGVISFSSERVK